MRVYAILESCEGVEWECGGYDDRIKGISIDLTIITNKFINYPYSDYARGNILELVEYNFVCDMYIDGDSYTVLDRKTL